MSEDRRLIHCPNCGEPLVDGAAVRFGGLTRKQRQCLDILAAHVAEHGHSPTMTEIAGLMQLKSKSNVARILDQLQERGRIRRTPRRACSIEIVQMRSRHAV